MIDQSEPLGIAKGHASDEDLAALIVLFSALGGQSDNSSQGVTPDLWANKADTFRHFPTPGPGVWRASGLVR